MGPPSNRGPSGAAAASRMADRGAPMGASMRAWPRFHATLTRWRMGGRPLQRRAEGGHGADGQHQHVALLGRLAGRETAQGFRQQLGMRQGIALGYRHHGAVQGCGGVGRLMLPGPHSQQRAPGMQQPVQKGQPCPYGVGVETEGRVLGAVPTAPGPWPRESAYPAPVRPG